MNEEKYNDDTIFKFGKQHLGKRLEDVPANYLLWMFYQPWFGQLKYDRLREYIAEHWDVLQKEESEQKPKF